MELYVFAAKFPELYAMLDETVRSTIVSNNMNGEQSLKDWDNMIDNYVRNFENEKYYGQEMREISSQQIPYNVYWGRDGRDRDRDRDRDWDRGRDWDRNRDWDRYRDYRQFYDFNIRDIIRILYLRQLFDRDRH